MALGQTESKATAKHTSTTHLALVSGMKQRNTPKRCFLTLVAARAVFLFSSILTRHDISSMKFTIQSGDFPGAQESQRIGGGRRGAWAPISDLHSNQ